MLDAITFIFRTVVFTIESQFVWLARKSIEDFLKLLLKKPKEIYSQVKICEIITEPTCVTILVNCATIISRHSHLVCFPDQIPEVFISSIDGPG